MFLALHGNVGTVHDFAFLSGYGEMEAIDLWPLTERSLPEAAKDLKSRVPEGSSFRGLIGYSMGGRLALSCLAGDPDFWDVAIVISAHPGLVNDRERAIRVKEDTGWAYLVRHGDWKSFIRSWNAQPVLAGSDPSPHQAELESEQENIARGFENWSLGSQDDLRPALEKCRSKVVWVAGREDEKFVSLGREMKELIPDCELIEVPACGHRVLLDAPEAVKQIVSRISRYTMG